MSVIKLGGSALHNARRALESITTAVLERRAVTDALDSPTAHGDLERLSRKECLTLMSRRSFGRLAYIARAGVPDIVPVNYVMDGEDVLISSAPGPKLQAAERGDQVAFEVDHVDEESRTAWSVVMVGTIERVPTADARAPRPDTWAGGSRRHLMRIRPSRIDGRRLL
jgi:nitroimidazol reductase NimA-like FMN-containing flavoprotein (pyridoxamine 5'-phosphate oxidase superfamily)